MPSSLQKAPQLKPCGESGGPVAGLSVSTGSLDDPLCPPATAKRTISSGPASDKLADRFSCLAPFHPAEMPLLAIPLIA